MTLKQRSEIASNDKWKVELLYRSISHWKQDYESAIEAKNGQPRWTELNHFQGRLGESPEVMQEALDLLMSEARLLSKIYTYAHLRHDEDIADNENKIAYNQALAALMEFRHSVAWFEPEILSLPEETLNAFIHSSALKDYRFHLEKLVHLKKHTLPPAEETLLALAARPLQSVHKAFSALSDADFVFGNVKDSAGKEHLLTHGSMSALVRNPDRILRKNAFLTLHEKYRAHENTLAELLSGQIQMHIFNSKARKYNSCLQAALHPNNIDLQVYHSLIETAGSHLEPLHRYLALRKKILNLDALHLYDMTTPLIADFDMQMSYDEAEQLVIDSVAPLGAEYQNILHDGLKNGRWVDRYENKNKRSGAYSSGCYDSNPYILMNFKGLMRDAFVLAHEAGHSMHSFLSHKNQPFQYADYPIFLAEVASTFNEELLTRHLLKTNCSIDEKIFLINQKIEDIRATFFRQTMFAEFELLIHTSAEQSIPLTPQFLNSAYAKLLKKYMGNDVVIDKEAESEWARIPHFYYNFYVYQYATGMSAALTLADQVLSGGDKAKERYLDFLRSGCSKYPIETLKLAGVDMCSATPTETTLNRFNKLVDDLEALIEEKQAVST